MNEKRKEEFVEFLNPSHQMELSIKAMFNQISAFEELQQRDVCEFDVAMLSDVFSISGWYNASTFTVYRKWIEKYITWCISQGLCDHTNAATRLTKDSLSPILMQQKLYRDVEDFLETMSDIYHYEPGAECKVAEDRFVIHEVLWHLAWLGFLKIEALSIRKNQVDFERKRIDTATWSVELPETFISLFKRAINLDVAVIYEETSKVARYRQKPLADTPYLIRPFQTAKQEYGAPTNPHAIDLWGQKAKALQKGNCPPMSKTGMKKVNYQTIFACGRYAALHQWEQRYGEATLDNLEMWCWLVRRQNAETGDPKQSSATFLRSYKQWKKAFYPVY